jgi:very-short-patch-repair endonuclease
MHADSNIQHVAVEQGGAITRAQALDAGLTRRQIDLRLRSGRWQHLVAGGYRVFSMDAQIDVVKAAVALLPEAVASHASAAAIHSIGRAPAGQPTVTVHSRTTHQFPGVRVVRCLDLAPSHVTQSPGFPITTPARTIVDLAASLTPGHIGAIVDESIAARLTTIREINGVLNDVARRGKPGVSTMRVVLGDRAGETLPASVLEARALRVLVNAGIRGFETEVPIPWSSTRRFDVAFVEHRVAIEWDSRRWHLQASAFQSDRDRGREAVLHGWRLLRFTWSDVHERPETVASTVRTVLSAHFTS